MTEPTFESHLMVLRENGFWLSNLMEFPMYPAKPWRVVLRHKSGPSIVLGMGWGTNPLAALLEAEVAYAKELAWHNQAPAKQPKLNITLEDLGVV